MKQQTSIACNYSEACDLLRSGYVKHVLLNWNVGSGERNLRIPFTLDDETLRRAFSTLQPIWATLAGQHGANKVRKII